MVTDVHEFSKLVRSFIDQLTVECSMNCNFCSVEFFKIFENSRISIRFFFFENVSINVLTFERSSRHLTILSKYSFLFFSVTTIDFPPVFNSRSTIRPSSSSVTQNVNPKLLPEPMSLSRIHCND